ncbi:MAG: hypothetical protein ACM3WP_13885 [Acidobacteriota bacterium]
MSPATHKGDLFAIGGPTGQRGIDGPVGKLYALASINAGAARGQLGIADVNDPLPVRGKVGLSGRDSGEIWPELAGSCVVAN